MYNEFHGEFGYDGPWAANKHTKRLDQFLRDFWPDYSYKGVMLDIGAYKPVTNNNSYHFEKKWMGSNMF